MRSKRQKELVDDYVVFDLETTGFDAINDEIIEIGALKYRNNALVEEFSVLVKPKVNIPEVITNITGINDEMVKDSKSIEEVLPKFLEFIEDLTLVAHNSKFDISFIEEKIKQLNLPLLENTNIDTVWLAREYIPDTVDAKLETLKKHFNLDYGSHRSLEDCMTTNYVYQYCKSKALVKN